MQDYIGVDQEAQPGADDVAWGKSKGLSYFLEVGVGLGDKGDSNYKY